LHLQTAKQLRVHGHDDGRFCVKTPQYLSQVSLKAGDDAKRVLVAKISSLAPDEFGIADHLAMNRAAQVAVDALSGV